MAVPSLHATAVAIDGEALLICGPSRAGKSRLAMALIARSTPARPIVLVGDDRVLLQEDASRLVARPHPRIAGFLERRGLGIVAMDWEPEAPVGGLVDLRDVGCGHEYRGMRQVPHLTLSPEEADPDHVLAWWINRGAAGAPHLAAKARPFDRPRAKD